MRKSLYEHIEYLYNNSNEYKSEFTLNEFMESWVEENYSAYPHCSHEEFLFEEFLGEFELSYEINHDNKTILFYMEEC